MEITSSQNDPATIKEKKKKKRKERKKRKGRNRYSTSDGGKVRTDLLTRFLEVINWRRMRTGHIGLVCELAAST